MAGVEQVTDGIWWVGGGSWGGLTPVHSDEGSGNVFLVGQGQYALIDAGMPEGVDAVLANAAAAGAEPADIRKIVLTHAHWDHVAAAGMLAARTGARMVAADLTAAALGDDPDARRRLFVPDKVHVKVDDVLADGDPLSIGPYAFTVMHTPGHIPGSITLAGDVAGVKVVITGDTAIGDQGAATGVVGWLDGHWGSNPKHLLESIGRIARCDADLLVPGHGFPIRGAQAVRTALEHCADRLRQLLAIPDLGSMMPLDLSD